jgi:hypothetical protein
MRFINAATSPIAALIEYSRTMIQFSARLCVREIFATVNFLSIADGGRKPPMPKDWLECIMEIGGRHFDVRLHFDNTGALSPGQTARVPISLLYLEDAREHCSVGKTFLLRQGDVIGKGVIDGVIFP